MRRRELASIVLKIIGLYGIVQSLPALPWYVLLPQYSGLHSMYDIFRPGSAVILGGVLLVFSDALSPLLLPDPDRQITAFKFKSRDVLAIAVLVIGLRLLVPAIVGLALLPLRIIQEKSVSLPVDKQWGDMLLQSMRHEFIKSTIATGLNFLLGILLIFGSRTIAGFINESAGSVHAE